MYVHQTKVRVRYGETDQMGYLYYGNYALYYEVGRVEMLRALGMTYRMMEEELKVMMPVMTLNVRYTRPVFYDDLITVQTTIKEIPERSIIFHMELFNESGKLVNGGTVKLGFIDAVEKKRIDAPASFVEKLIPFFEQNEK